MYFQPYESYSGSLALDEMKPVTLGLELSELAGQAYGKKLIEMNLEKLYMNDTC